MPNNTSHALEEGIALRLDFTKIDKVAQSSPGVIPVAVQDVATQEVILIAYINQRAFEQSLATGILTLWSTSRNELWIKGKQSGNTYEIIEARVNCEQNSLLFRVRAQASGICHTKNQQGTSRNCYYRRVNLETRQLENLDP